MSEPILEVRNLNVFYREKRNSRRKRQVLHDVSFTLFEDEILGLIGPSACGKSTLARTILGLESDYTGEIIHHSRRPQLVFQDPLSALNPRHTVGRTLEEPLLLQGVRDRRRRAAEADVMLKQAGLPIAYRTRYPHELSGGERQRVSIAAALLSHPKLLIADEPTSALDAAIEAQILELLLSLRRQYKLSYLLISHDMSVIRRMCSRVLTMQDGRIEGQP